MSISIVIPAYNQAEYLEDCIESCYNQTTSPHEIIVVNDGSTDNTQEVAERYMFKEFPLISSPVRVINQTNKGLPSARNTGIMNATGDYILFLDSDDMLMENAIEVITKAIQESKFDVIAPSFRAFGKVNQDVVLGAFSLDDLKQANRLGYFSAFRRQILLEMGGYNPKMRWGYEDYDLWFEVFKRGYSIFVLQDTLVKYRTKENSMLSDAQQNHHDELMTQIRRNHPSLWQ